MIFEKTVITVEQANKNLQGTGLTITPTPMKNKGHYTYTVTLIKTKQNKYSGLTSPQFESLQKCWDWLLKYHKQKKALKGIMLDPETYETFKKQCKKHDTTTNKQINHLMTLQVKKWMGNGNTSIDGTSPKTKRSRTTTRTNKH